MKLLVMSLLILTTSLSYANECEKAIGVSYSRAITEIARGLIKLENMEMSSAKGVSEKTLERELKRQQQELISIIGKAKFEAALKLALEVESRLSKIDRREKIEKRQQVVESESVLSFWFQEFSLPKNEKSHPNIEISPNSKLLAVPSNTGDGEIWDLETGKKILDLTPSRKFEYKAYYHFKFSPDGSYILGASSSGDVCAWKTDTGEELYCLPHKNAGDGIAHLEFTPDGRFFVTASSSDGLIRVWNAETHELHFKIKHSDDQLGYLRLSPDGQHMLFKTRKWYSRDKGARHTIRVVDIVNKTRLGKIETEAAVMDTPEFTQAEFTNDGKHIIVAQKSEGITIWDFNPNPSIATWVLGKVGYKEAVQVKKLKTESWAYHFAYSADRSLLFLTGIAHYMDLVSANNYETIVAKQPHSNPMVGSYHGQVFSPDNREIILHGENGYLTILSPSSLEALHVFDTASYSSPRFSPNGMFLVLADSGGHVSVWKKTKPEVGE